MKRLLIFLVLIASLLTDIGNGGNQLHPLDVIKKEFMPEEAEINLLELFVGKKKWCGFKNEADSLDLIRNVTICCEAHDACPDVILPGDKKYGLHNTWTYTRVNCVCDEMFYFCLKRAGGVAGYVARRLYFQYLERECFILDYPLECAEWEGQSWLWSHQRCTRFEPYRKYGRVWQWRKSEIFAR